MAAPNGGWKCGNEYDFTVTITYTDPGGLEYCTKTWKNDCKHWLWGSRTILSSVTTVCNPYQGTPSAGDIASVNHHMQICDIMAQIMTEIKNAGVVVPDEYCNADSLYINDETFKECEEFRLLLAGYDIDLDDPIVQEACYVPVITLPVIVPAAGVFELNEECITVSPNPATSTFNLIMGSGNNYVSKIELIQNISASIVFVKEGSIQSTEAISTSSLNTGLYTVRIYNGEYIITKLVQVVN